MIATEIIHNYTDTLLKYWRQFIGHTMTYFPNCLFGLPKSTLFDAISEVGCADFAAIRVPPLPPAREGLCPFPAPTPRVLRGAGAGKQKKPTTLRWVSLEIGDAFQLKRDSLDDRRFSCRKPMIDGIELVPPAPIESMEVVSKSTGRK